MAKDRARHIGFNGRCKAVLATHYEYLSIYLQSTRSLLYLCEETCSSNKSKPMARAAKSRSSLAYPRLVFTNKQLVLAAHVCLTETTTS